MPKTMILSNACLILPETTRIGALHIKDGVIVDISYGADVGRGAIDCEGAFVCPGLVELHTDNLERHITPRPRVRWPEAPAIIAHDRELAGTGITTVFDAIRVGSLINTTARGAGRYARALVDDLQGLKGDGVLSISHHIHLRAEVCSETLLEELDEFRPSDGIGILSLMDHTPGQRQFRDLEKYEKYVRGKAELSRQEFLSRLAFLTDLRARIGDAHEAAAVAAADRLGAALASHDDTTAEHVATSAAYGVKIAEFPTTVEAAQACKAAGIGTLMGAPNLIRGGSHSGNVAVQELAELDCVDMLSSDYVPSALLLAGVRLGEIWGDMAKGLATVTSAPARQVGLTDRGKLEVGARADVLRFSLREAAPVVREVYVEGVRVA